MRALFVNGSPRKSWNTATLLKKAQAGAKAAGAETELVHLYEHEYKGCVSCFECKKIGGRSYGRCAYKDGLSALLDKAANADALVLGSPVYFQAETGEMRSFMERLLFPYVTYTPERRVLFPRKIPTAFLYTMNIAGKDMPVYGMDTRVAAARSYLELVFGACELLLCTDTLQFKDYSKYESSRWDPEAKAKRREEVFPLDCQKAYELGERLARRARGAEKNETSEILACQG
jgi:multimeric flavodoxin WrbA